MSELALRQVPARARKTPTRESARGEELQANGVRRRASLLKPNAGELRAAHSRVVASVIAYRASRPTVDLARITADLEQPDSRRIRS
jgi:hypothetical protein